MTELKCVVEGCQSEYDVTCSFSFYNANTASENEVRRQEWIDGAMQDESECLWRHVSLNLCGYHFEQDNQGLWIDSPMLPELLTLQDRPTHQPTQDEKKIAEVIKTEHNYCAPRPKDEPPENISRLNVRQLVDTLGYLSLKNLQRKQLWVVKVETEKAEASIMQSEQVITKMPDPRQIIEIIPQTGGGSGGGEVVQGEEMAMLEESHIPDNLIFEIAEEQEITMDEVKEIPAAENQEWMVNILPDDTKPKYAYIKHCSTGRKKRHFTADVSEITLQGDFENYYILPDVDPSENVEVSTSYDSENYIVEEYEHLVLDERPKKEKKKRRKVAQQNVVLKQEPRDMPLTDSEDWSIEQAVVYEDSDDYEDKKAAARVRRKNKKYLGYDFVT